MKPATEPIVVARKPLCGTVAKNVLEHGVGGMNIDGCRVEGAWTTWKRNDGTINPSAGFGDEYVNGEERPEGVRNPEHPAGRWPANLILSHHPDCIPCGTHSDVVGGGSRGSSGFVDGYGSGDGFVGREVVSETWECVEDCPVAMLDAQSGTSKSPAPGMVRLKRSAAENDGNTSAAYGKENRAAGYVCKTHGDTGGASRFFYHAKSSTKDRNKYIPPCDCKKADKCPSPAKVTDESATTGGSAWSTTSCGSQPTAPSPPDSRSTTEIATNSTTQSPTSNSLTHSPTSASIPGASCGMGSGGSPAGDAESSSPLTLVTGTSADKDGPSTAGAGPVTSASSSKTSKPEGDGMRCPDCGKATRNFHATVKPIALMSYLIRLVTPPNAIILDPFMGSGTTGLAAVEGHGEHGWVFYGIERDTAYFKLAMGRIAACVRECVADQAADVATA